MKINGHQLAAIATLCAFGAFATAAAQTPTCQNVQYGDAVMEKFPNARLACLDVIERDGRILSVHKAEVTRVYSSGVKVRFQLPDGKKSEPRYITTRPDFRVIVDGKPLRVRDLVVGQELTVYAAVDRPMMSLQPVTETEPLALEPMETEAPAAELASTQSQSMPKTGSNLPLLGLLGGLFAFLGSLVTVARRR